MKKTMIPLVVDVYLIILSIILVYFTDHGATMFYIFGLLGIFLAIANILNAALFNHDDRVYKETLIFKIILIPFYVLNFIFGMAVMITTVLLALCIILAWLALPALLLGIAMIMFTYLLMISTSSYTIVKKIKMILNNNSKDMVTDIILTILQFIFVVDLVSTIIIYNNERNFIVYEKR